MGAFSTPLSGLTAAQDQLQSVSNNLANIDTDGYKDQTLTFSDIFAQTGATNGAGDPIQTGSGVTVASTDADFSEGTLNSTGTSSNMAVSGSGFFVVQSGSQNFYTRAGDFTTNTAGQISTPNGDSVLGYPAVGGVVNTAAALQPLQVASAPAASTTIDITGNLSSATAVNGTVTGAATVYDSLGNAYPLTVTYTETAADAATGVNTWSYAVAETGGGPAVSVTGGTGTLTFNAAGTLTSTTAVPITLTGLPAGAASPQTVACSFGTSGSYTLTQTSAATLTTASTDGSLAEPVASYSVASDGVITGTFANGETAVLGQVAVANFANEQGLANVGNNNYEATLSSGQPITISSNSLLAGTNGAGTIVGGSVEGSNVNIATEFAKLIVAQQAYSANAKSITAFNQVSQATIAMLQ